MNISQDVINEIRSRSDIVEIVGEYLPLIKKGKSYFGVCPFHDDTNPSMSVSKEKQIFKCFSCGATGNVIKFVMDYEHISFQEALKVLADKQGIEFTYNKHSEIRKDNYQYEIYSLLNKFYVNNINASVGKEARTYLNNRGITDNLIKEFNIGLALKEYDTASKLLLAKGYKEVDLINLGITNRNETRINDVFYNRIMFPIWDVSGHVVAYSGRIYEHQDTSKYINTKETTLFKKGQVLYNYHRAKEDVRNKKYVILMEGQMDVIRAFSIGVKNAIATMGTALTKEHIGLIKRLSNNIIICFDGDSAGAKATLAAGDMLNKAGLDVKVVRLPDNLDPDDYIMKNGQERFTLVLETAYSFIDYKIEHYKTLYNIHDSLGVSKFLEIILKDVSEITDNILKEAVLNKLARELDIGLETLKGLLKAPVSEKVVAKPVKEVNKRLDKYDVAERNLLYYMINDEQVISIVSSRGVFFKRQEFRYLANEIIYYYKENEHFLIADFLSYLNDKNDLLTALNEILLLELPGAYMAGEIEDYINVLKDYYVVVEVNRLKEMMKRELDPIKKSEIALKIVELGRGIIC